MSKLTKALIALGVVVFAAAALWRPVVEPRLVKLPGDIDRTDQYKGTFVTFVDQATGATLATPVEKPLTIDRHVYSVAGATGANVSLLHETITAHMGDQTVVQDNVYAVDRRTMQNVADSRAWTFTPGNVVDRTGTYYLTLPMDLRSSGEQLQIWKPEAGASYGLTSTTPAKGKEAGTSVVYLKGDIPTPVPVASYELDALKAQGLPMALSPEQSAAKLAASGIDVAALAPVLAQALTPDELATVSTAVTAPVPLHYFVYGHGILGAEPTTGGLVALSDIVDGVSVQPDTTAISSALAVLQKHTDVPAIASLVTTLQATVSAAPVPVYELRYTQTPESVATAASYAGSQADKVTLATVTIPRTAFAASFLLLGAGAVTFLRSRPPRRHLAPVPALPVEEQPHKAA